MAESEFREAVRMRTEVGERTAACVSRGPRLAPVEAPAKEAAELGGASGILMEFCQVVRNARSRDSLDRGWMRSVDWAAFLGWALYGPVSTSAQEPRPVHWLPSAVRVSSLLEWSDKGSSKDGIEHRKFMIKVMYSGPTPRMLSCLMGKGEKGLDVWQMD